MSIVKWLDLDISLLDINADPSFTSANINSLFDIDRLYAYLKSKGNPDMVLDLFGKHRYFVLLLMKSGAADNDTRLLEQIAESKSSNFAAGLWLEDIGRTDLVVAVYQISSLQRDHRMSCI